ncbi:unnamed protein product [Blepharisma stoltei]|uniref:Calcium-dependent protein kinase 1 n=1 Tax=Blepharisma stoltei TaxID=1481888 RepID=A0AAU9JM02_9CILI|nr:unnamed protein product [Blepharisma stoltei]
MGCCTSSKSSRQKSHKAEKSEKNELPISPSNFVQLIKGKVTDRYQLGKILGDGGFGQVKLGMQKETQIERAIKFIPVEATDDAKISKMMEEVNILKKLDHPNIIKVFEVYQDTRYLCIVTELCTGGELFDRIKEANPFTENQAARYMLDMVSAVKYCHEAGIVHRDLKPENLLLENKKPDARLKLIDFGTSKHFEPKEKMKHFIGTSYYVAPEVISGSYDSKCDVWSLGVILYIMLSGYPPFNGRSDEEIYKKIQKAPLSFRSTNGNWNNVAKETKDFIKLLLTKDPAKRPDITEVYNNDWLQSRANNRVEDIPVSKESLELLSSFNTQSKLQRATMTFIASQLVSNDEIAHLRDTFQSLDENGDGKLSTSELKNGFSKLPGHINIDVNEMMNQLDADGNGFIDYTEFLTAAINWSKTLNKERLLAAFKHFDKDGSGKISLEELREALGGNEDSDHVFLAMLADADKNGDGEIDLEEFTQVMISKVENKPHKNRI